MQVILSLNSTINYMNCGKDVYQYPSCHNSHPKLAQVQSEDKTCDWMAKDDYRNLGGGGGGEEGAAVVIYFLMNLLVLVM